MGRVPCVPRQACPWCEQFKPPWGSPSQCYNMDFSHKLCLARSGSRSEAQRRIILLFTFPLVFGCLALIFSAIVRTEFCSAVGGTLWKCTAPCKGKHFLRKKNLILKMSRQSWQSAVSFCHIAVSCKWQCIVQ